MPGESDVESDKRVARSRKIGGRPDGSEPDAGSSTGTTENETFVGRAAGQDEGYDEQTGAEARAAEENDAEDRSADRR